MTAYRYSSSVFSKRMPRGIEYTVPVISSILVSLVTALLAGCSPEPPDEAPSADRSIPAEARDDARSVTPELPADAELLLASDQSVVRLQSDDLTAGVPNNTTIRDSIERGDFEIAALEFLDIHSDTFRLVAPRDEFTVLRIDEDQLGYHHVRLTQRFSGILVFGAELIVHFDDQNRLYLINGDYLPTPTALDPVPALSETGALDKAMSLAPDARSIEPPELVIIIGDGRLPMLAYVVGVTESLIKRYQLFIDANNGEQLQELATVFE